MTVAQIEAWATAKGYTLHGSTKAEKIASFLAIQHGPYTEDELGEMTVEEITALAAALGYTVTETDKDDLIAEFIAAQEG